MQEYMCHPKVPTLDFSSKSESKDSWNSDLDYGSPESEFSSGLECSDPYKGSKGESKKYSSDEEDYSQGHHNQYHADHSSSDSENDEISNLDSDGCTSESDSVDLDSNEYSESDCDDVYDSEES
jgi:hypothetical protein